MFWGLIMDSNKKYTQTIDKSFHVSMASLDVNKSNDQVIQIGVLYENTSYLLCSLQKGVTLQQSLDLNFAAGTKVSFSCNGSGRVYLTGYLIIDDELDVEDDDEDEEIVSVHNKRKSNTQKDGLINAKKFKFDANEEDDEDEDEDENDSDGLDSSSMNVDSDSDDEDDDEAEDQDDENEEESDDDSKEEIVEVPEQLSKKKKQKQNQNQSPNQNESQQQNKKDKNKLMNGSDLKAEKQQEKQKKNKDKSKQPEQQQPKKRMVDGGVLIEDIKVGNGAPAELGKTLSVYYMGRLKNGKVFDQVMKGKCFKFRLGKAEVIKGLDAGVEGMKEGGKRRLIIPPHMAYGTKGSLPVIPPNSQLTFEVELKQVH